MRPVFLLCSFFLLTVVASGQQFYAETPVQLASAVAESSGLLLLNGKVFTHNDSGNKNALYEINPETGAVTRTVIISGASNTDWEDLCADEQYLYIGDFGNNASGNRQDLVIYRIPRTDFENSANDTVLAESIPFAYSDQTDFSAQPNNHTNYDAEALIAYNDSLYVFTKNWLTYTCNIYSIPKTPSANVYQSKRVDSFNANGLVTGADYNPDTHSVVICAYNLAGGPFNPVSYLIMLTNFFDNQFSGGNITSHQFDFTLISPQIEGITFTDPTHFYVTAEEAESVFTFPAYLRKVEWDGAGYPVGMPQVESPLYLPVKNEVSYKSNQPVFFRVYNPSGQLIEQAFGPSVNLANLPRGVVFVQVLDAHGNRLAGRSIWLR